MTVSRPRCQANGLLPRLNERRVWSPDHGLGLETGLEVRNCALGLRLLSAADAQDP